MKQIVYALLSISLLVGLTGIAGCTGLPTVFPSGEGETPGAREPEGKLLQLYPGELANQLRNEGLTELQRKNIWNKYKGKRVKWVGQVMDVKTWNDSPVVTFLNRASVHVVLICGKKQEENLVSLSKNDLAIYSGILEAYGKDSDLFPPDGILKSQRQILKLKNGVIHGLLLTPLWSNQDIDVKNLDDEVVFSNNVLYVTVSTNLGSNQYGRIMYALDIQNGKTLWQSGPHEGVYRVLGVDKDYIYLLFSHSHRVPWGVSISAPGVITLDKATGQISSTKKLFVEYNYSPYILWADNGAAYVYEGHNDKLTALDIITEADLWSLDFSPYPLSGGANCIEELVRVGSNTVFIERENGELLALDENTGKERYVKEPCFILGFDPISKKVFLQTHSGLQCIDEITGELLWQNKQFSVNRDRLNFIGVCGNTLIICVWEEYLYLFPHDTYYSADILYTFDINTGRLKWSDCIYEGNSPLAAGNGLVLFTATGDGLPSLQASRLQELP